MRLHCYWSLDPTSELRLGSDEEYAAAYREMFTEAVRCRLRSAFPRGSHLSGGLDSSSVTCVARKLSQQTDTARWHTFSNIFEDVPQCDERPFINAVLAQGGYIPHYIHADRSSPLMDLERVFWHQEEPAIGPNHFLPWQLNRAASQAGVRVVLDGFDGDTTVSHGAVRFTELALCWGVENIRSGGERSLATLQGFAAQSLASVMVLRLWKSWQNVSDGWPLPRLLIRSTDIFKVSRREILWQHGLKSLLPSRILRRKKKINWMLFILS